MNQSVVNEINNINMVIDDNISEKDYLIEVCYHKIFWHN